MLNFLGKRLLQLIPTLFFVSVIIFSLQQLLPGDPATIMAGEDRDPEVIAQIRHQYRLDQPIPVQYVYWVKGVFSGDLGESMRIHVPVLDLIAQKLPVTIQLAADGLRDRADHRRRRRRTIGGQEGHRLGLRANAFALWGISTPNFWLGIMLIFSFFSKARLVAGGGLRAAIRGLAGEPRHNDHAGFRARQFDRRRADAAHPQRHAASAGKRLRAHARAKGLLERTVIIKHAMRNALTPVITLGALELGTLLSGAVLTEQIFTIPGFGKLIVDAVFNRDYAVVQGVVLVTATIYIALNLLADIAYILVNPRLRG